jgi:hypothetical protein
MQQKLNLKEIERQAFRSTFFQDGLVDMLLGLIFMMMAFVAWLETRGLVENGGLAVYFALLITIVVGWWGVRRWVAAPRLGHARFGRRRKRRLFNTNLVVTGSVLVGAVLAVLAGTTGFKDETPILAIFAANIMIVFSLTAYALDFNRLYFYAPLFAASLPVGELLWRHDGLARPVYILFVTGGLVAGIGLVLFVRFVRGYAPPSQDDYAEVMNNGSA